MEKIFQNGKPAKYYANHLLAQPTHPVTVPCLGQRRSHGV